jgi:hypothetical protein
VVPGVPAAAEVDAAGKAKKYMSPVTAVAFALNVKVPLEFAVT